MSESETQALPYELEMVKEEALRALGEIQPARPKSNAESRGLLLASRTDGGRNLPPYYLVYFLLVDLLGFPNLGKWEKVAWAVPISFRGRLYSVEHRKMGLGIFAPKLDPEARMSASPSEDAEADAREISALIRNSVNKAESYFEWRAAQEAGGNQLNVYNKSRELFERYEFFQSCYASKSEEAQRRKDEREVTVHEYEGGQSTSYHFPSFALRQESEWYGQAAIEAFFSWTEHAFIHLAIVQGKVQSGDEVERLANSDWKAKFKAALDLECTDTKRHYDSLLDLRAQIRNFMAHGAFGKRGEAFHFHSGAGAVPVLLTGRQGHRYALSSNPPFNEKTALQSIDEFIQHLWSPPRSATKQFLFSDLPSILTYVVDGTYENAMKSDEAMEEFLDHLAYRFDMAANMDW